MEKIGFAFKIPNEWNNNLYKLIAGLLETPSKWSRGDHEEILVSNGDNVESNTLFPYNQKMMDNIQMKKILTHMDRDYYPIFVSFSIYSPNETSCPPIQTMGEFLNTTCETVMSINDSTNVIIVSKQHAILNNIEEIYYKYGFQDIYELDMKENMTLMF